MGNVQVVTVLCLKSDDLHQVCRPENTVGDRTGNFSPDVSFIGKIINPENQDKKY
jgi:hypothetical protein